MYRIKMVLNILLVVVYYLWYLLIIIINYALQNIYNNIYKITYPGVYYRRDIGCNNIINNTIMPKVGVLASGNGTCLSHLFKHKKDCIKLIITNKSDAGIIYNAWII